MPVLFSRRSQTLIVVDSNNNNKNKNQHHPLLPSTHEESTTSLGGRQQEMGNIESASCFCIAGNEELSKQTALLHLDNNNPKTNNNNHHHHHHNGDCTTTTTTTTTTSSAVQQLNDSRQGSSDCNAEKGCSIEASSTVCQQEEKKEMESIYVQTNGSSHMLNDDKKSSQVESHNHEHNNTTSNGGSDVVVVNKSHRRHLSKFLIHGSTRLLQKASGTVSHVLGRIEDLIFPPSITSNLHHHNGHHNIPKNVRGGILLHGCTTAEEHYALIKQILSDIKDLHGTEGLKKIGFEYRLVPCELHRSNNDVVIETYDDNNNNNNNNNHNIDANIVGYSNTILLHTEKVNFNDDDDSSILEFKNNNNKYNNGGGAITASSSLVLNHSNLDIASQISNCDDIDDIDNDDNDSGNNNNSQQTNDDDDFFVSNPVIAVSEVTNPQYAMCRCHFCMRKLFHIETNQLIDNTNRNKFIADGDMYEDISRLVQEVAFDVLIDEAELKWITIWEPNENDDTNNRHKKPIRALINSDHPLLNDNEQHEQTENEQQQRNIILKDRPTLFIFTGRGKVRAGIFSRQHLICNGMEGSTCLPFIREAQARNLNVFIIDPNINGDSNGYNTFQKTMDYWCNLCNKHNNNNMKICRDVYILSHSASGGHLVRYLLEPKPKKYLLRYMKAVAFTDSTHNIQWTKKSIEHIKLHEYIQSEYCVYFRCGKINRDIPVDSSQWYLHPPGEEVITDTYWQHRFGLIKTMWAGTDDHSLTNWFAMSKIWEHFDKFLYTIPKEEECNTNNSNPTE